MSQTGANLLSYLNQKVSASYTGYLDNTKANNLFNDALISLCEKIYRKDNGDRQWDEIKELDELTFLTNVKVPFGSYGIPNNNLLQTNPLQIIGVSINSATSYKVTTLLPHYLVVGTAGTITGVQGTLNIPTLNSTFSVASIVSGNSFIVTVSSATGVYVPNTGQVVTEITLSNYWHLLAIKPTFYTPIYGLQVTAATNNLYAIILTLNNRSIIRTGNQVNISGVQGNNAANGLKYVLVRNDFNIQLFSDANLQIPVLGNGSYTSGGTISMVNANYASPLTSKMKQGVLNIPTPQAPYFEIANNLIKIHPLSQPIISGLIDYIQVPPVIINVNDAVTDLTLYYPEKFLFRVVDEAASIYAEITRDLELLQMSNVNQQKNP